MLVINNVISVLACCTIATIEQFRAVARKSIVNRVNKILLKENLFCANRKNVHEKNKSYAQKKRAKKGVSVCKKQNDTSQRGT